MTELKAIAIIIALVIGVVIGDRVASERQVGTGPKERCEQIVNQEEQ